MAEKVSEGTGGAGVHRRRRHAGRDGGDGKARAALGAESKAGMAVSGALAAETGGASFGAAEIRFPRPRFEEALNKFTRQQREVSCPLIPLKSSGQRAVGGI